MINVGNLIYEERKNKSPGQFMVFPEEWKLKRTFMGKGKDGSPRGANEKSRMYWNAQKEQIRLKNKMRN